MKFSVVIPLYNKRPHIQRAIKSVLAQSNGDYEIIVIDDASTDGGADEIRRCENSRIRMLKRSVRGHDGSAARNLGIQTARAPWVAFLDADDEWEPGFLAEIASLQLRYPDISFFASAYLNAYADGSEVLNAYARRRRSGRQERISFRSYVRETSRGRCPAWTSVSVACTDLLVDVGMFPEDRCIRGGDVDTWLRLMTRTDLGWSSFVGATYHRDSVNMVTRTTIPHIEHCIDHTVNRLLQDGSSAESRSSIRKASLQRLAHNYKKPAIKRKIRLGRLRANDLRTLSFRAEPLYYAYVFLCAMLPGWMVKGAVDIYRATKAALRAIRGDTTMRRKRTDHHLRSG